MGNEAMRAFFEEMEQHFSILTPEEQRLLRDQMAQSLHQSTEGMLPGPVRVVSDGERTKLPIDAEKAYAELEAALRALPTKDLKTSKAFTKLVLKMSETRGGHEDPAKAFSHQAMQQYLDRLEKALAHRSSEGEG